MTPGTGTVCNFTNTYDTVKWRNFPGKVIVMVLGFNHNVMYKGEVFHVQTEDSGITNPHIITILYRGGVIISSKKTSYADIMKIENLEIVVEELMKEQHKEIMRRLKSGEFDEKAFAIKAPLIQNYEISPPAPDSATGRGVFSGSASSVSEQKGGISRLFELPKQSTADNVSLPPGNSVKQSAVKNRAIDLEEAVLSVFSSREK
jgi:hypothetical protein